MRRAVIDVGSNSVLLVVAERSNGTWNPVYEDTEVTALGEGTKQTGLLSESAMERTLSAIKRFADLAKSHDSEQITIAATMAARIATNQQEFLERGERQGTPIKILSGEEEAELGFLAVANDPKFSAHTRISIVDPGGHSTEIVTAQRTPEGWTTLFRRSHPVGTLMLKSSAFPTERVSSLEVLRGSAMIDDIVGLCYRQNECGLVVALGAAGTNLVSIRDGLVEWQPERVHGVELQYEEISRAVSRLMPMSDAERAAIPGMEKGREKTTHLGALLLERFLFVLRAESCFVSVRGWRHALLEKEGAEPL